MYVGVNQGEASFFLLSYIVLYYGVDQMTVEDMYIVLVVIPSSRSRAPCYRCPVPGLNRKAMNIRRNDTGFNEESSLG